MSQTLKKIVVPSLFIFLAFTSLSNISKAVVVDWPKLTEATKKLGWNTRCKSIENIVDKKIIKFEEVKDGHYDNYITFKEKFLEKVNVWDKDGYDVTKLKEQSTTLDEKVKKFSTDSTSYIARLKEIANNPCGKSESEYDTTVRNAKDSLRIVKKDTVDIRTYYQTVIRKSILALEN